MKRREFLTVLGGAAAAWPFAAQAQKISEPVIGYLGSASPDAWAIRLQAFREGLSESGFDEGRNVAIEYRWAEGNLDRLPELASDLVGRNVAVLVAPGSAPAALAAKAATQTIPIVFETGADPVAAGLVPNLNRPGGNVTGVTALTFEIGPKRLEILHEAVPDADPIAVLINSTAGDVAERQSKDLQQAAQRLGLQLLLLYASNDDELDRAFKTMQDKKIRGVVITGDPFYNSEIEKIAAFSLRHAVATVFLTRSLPPPEA